MRTYLDAKVMAKSLRQALNEQNVHFTHSKCLELVAQQFGLADWNTLASEIEQKLQAKTLKLPEGWIISGSKSDAYEMGVEKAGQAGAALIRSKYSPDDSAYEDKKNSFGTLMQNFQAQNYLGKRVRLRAELRTIKVDGAATLWMRVDSLKGSVLSFDNMEMRSQEGTLSGTQEWIERQIVLNVPDTAETISFGFYLRGTGQVWARNFELIDVGNDIEVTERPKPELLKPSNLDFAKAS
ncbi:hypothetical protein SAMN05444141_1077 [Pseudovibrio denitrificans]|uniref:Glyoxalase-related protein domain-containing protein n=1 Tax=Pseudovibrio denitrificans TaxID=258256 RepID=A0A1I7CXZ5_9HYPH|nr:glyoxalase superfamily protein [Pseudovibrio denitrificans]SFU04279.1 hypothetical protein SAMN05444141_1077 [Pseudovibrio denitrificans]